MSLYVPHYRNLTQGQSCFKYHSNPFFLQFFILALIFYCSTSFFEIILKFAFQSFGAPTAFSIPLHLSSPTLPLEKCMPLQEQQTSKYHKLMFLLYLIECMLNITTLSLLLSFVFIQPALSFRFLLLEMLLLPQLRQTTLSYLLLTKLTCLHHLKIPFQSMSNRILCQVRNRPLHFFPLSFFPQGLEFYQLIFYLQPKLFLSN